MDKIDVNKLAILLAEHEGCDQELALLFVKEFVQQISAALDSGEEVHIADLGHFYVREVAGASTYQLDIDAAFRQEVNAPFSLFEPVEISPALKIETPAHDPEAAEELREQSLEVTPHTDEEYVPESSSTTTDVSAFVPEEDLPLVEEVDVVPTNLPEEIKKEYLPHIRRRKTPIQMNWPSLIGLFFLGLMGIMYFVVDYAKEVIMPQDSNTMTMSEVITSPVVPAEVYVDSLKQLTDSLQSLVDVRDSLEVGSLKEVLPKKMDLPNRPEWVVLKRGERLTLLAEKYYGSKFFWVYIYDYNKRKYPNPDLIPVGAKIFMPSAHYYQMDANDPTSIARAKELMRKILAK